ncbi:MAG: hypothetical protein Q7K45_03035 [Nanoarchaeota archaeon]|nr:hypothetical protein [Nanoarchaeota archaeon]
MDPNNHKTIERMVKAFEDIAQIIHEKNPDCIIAPMLGAVPFIDILNIVDDDFPNAKVEYVPASSKLHKLRDILRASFTNLIDAYAPNGGSFLSLDEVVSGNSLVRVYKQFEAARINYANRKTAQTYGDCVDFRDSAVQAYRQEIIEKIKYETIGIVDPKLEKRNKPQNREYLALVEQKIVLPVQTDGIVTMDRTDFFPAKYKTRASGQGDLYLPQIASFEANQEYITFLRTVAGIVGKDPALVTAQNIGKILDAHKLVPLELGGGKE